MSVIEQLARVEESWQRIRAAESELYAQLDALRVEREALLPERNRLRKLAPTWPRGAVEGGVFTEPDIGVTVNQRAELLVDGRTHTGWKAQ